MTITKGGTPTPTPTSSSDAGESAAVQQLMQSLGAQAGSSTGSGRVFMGFTSTAPNATLGNPEFMSEAAQANQQASQRSARAKRAPSWWSVDGATSNYFNWSQKARDDFRAKGLLSGLLTAGAGDMESFSLWQNLVNQAALYGAQGKQVSPLDILSGYVKSNSSGGWVRQGDFEVNPVTGEKRYIGPQFKTTTQTSTNLSDPATARAVATQVFQQLLGRDPNPGEISQYAQALSSSEAQNPSTTTTTTQYDPTTGEAVGSNSTTTGGMTDGERGLLASDAVKKKKEYGATQAATTYMTALENAVGGGS